MNMKERSAVVLVLAVAMLATQEVLAAGRVVSTRPFEVTVYPFMARVERRGSIRLPAGPHTLVIPDLPGSADEASLKVVVRGPRGTKLRGDRVRTIPGVSLVEDRARDLKKRIRALEDRKSAIEDRETARRDELAILRQPLPQPEEETRPGRKPASLEERAKGAEVIGKRIRVLQDEGRADAIVARDLDEQLVPLRREAQGNEAVPTDRREVELDLSLPAAGPVEVSLSYAVDDAAWEPVHDLVLDQSGRTPMVSIASGARIDQRTGEDWNDVRLVLSTARPAVAFLPRQTQVASASTAVPGSGISEKDRLNRPEPSSEEDSDSGRNRDHSGLRFGSASGQPTVALYSSSFSARVDTASVSSVAMGVEHRKGSSSAVVVEPVAASTAASERNPFAVQFRMPETTTVRSGAEIRRVRIAESTHAATVFLVSDPSKEQAARIEAAVAYRGTVPLLPGEAQVYQGGDFSGTAKIPAVSSGEELKVGFGVDALVKVERTLEAKSALDPQWSWFGTSTRMWRWKTTIVNGHADPRLIEVREWLPTWRESEFKVEPFVPTAGLLPDDPRREGLKRWQVVAKPGAPESIQFGFTIHHPPFRRPPDFG